MNKTLQFLTVTFGMILLPLYLFFIMYMGFIGISHEFGKLWAIVALFLAFCMFPVPLFIGAFWGFVSVWKWNYGITLLIISPTFLLILIAILQFKYSSFSFRARRKNKS